MRELQVLSTDPTPGAQGVSRLGLLRVWFGSSLDPESVGPGSVALVSGSVWPAVAVSYDPVDRTVEVRPLETLEPFTTYRLLIDEIEDLEGARLAERLEVAFATGVQAESPAEAPFPGWPEASAVLQANCASSACHGSNGPTGLDLSSPSGIVETAIGAPVRHGPSSVLGSEYGRGTRVLTAFPLVDVVAGAGRPATSYLIYKVLADPHAYGEAMPPPSGLALDEARTLAGWIAAGAPVE